MPNKRQKKRPHARKAASRKSDILDVHGAAALLMVSADTVYELLKSGQMPGRKVGRKWITTRSAVMRWIEGSLDLAATQRAIENSDKAAITKALQSGVVRVKAA
jgi:excisionase family DNA binding protein